MAGVIQRARDEGMEQGRVEGERAILERQLKRRFGLLPPATALRLDGASTADLEMWAENLLDAETLETCSGSVLELTFALMSGRLLHTWLVT